MSVKAWRSDMADADEKRLQGRVDWYRDEGYGVILGDDHREYFVHHSNLLEERALRVGDRVSFLARERQRGRGGQEAYDVRREAVSPGGQHKDYGPAAAKPSATKYPGSKQEPVRQPSTLSADESVQSTRRVAEEALRLKLARRQGIGPAQDELHSGMQVEHNQYGRGVIVLVLPTKVSVRFERTPGTLHDVPRAEIRPIVAKAPSPVPQPSKAVVPTREVRSAGNLRKLMEKLRAEVEETLSDEGLHGVTVYRFDDPIPAQQPPMPLPIDPVIANLYREVEGITTFYAHQVDMRRYLLEGKHVVISTPTASGKTEGYNPTILERLINDPAATALYIFPLVALGDDQLGRLQRLNNALPDQHRLELGIYNSGLDQVTKNRTLYANNRILVTTPDSLHYIFLPKPYPNWRNFYRNLRYVVLDEAHIYRGVLGANMANMMRRLLVRCRREGNPSFPQLIISSATIRHPLRLAQQLTGLPDTDFVLIDKSGAMAPGRHYLVTRSDIHDLSELCADLMTVTTQDVRTGVSRPVRIIVFQRSINGVKQSAQRLRDYLRRQKQNELVPQVEEFYSERSTKRDVFAALRQGKIRCLFTTTALMAGIDVGSLDVAIVDGFPGKVMDARQMFGRAGRTSEGAAIFIARPTDPFDQFYFERPDILFSGQTEDVVANPENPYILTAHLKCAAQVENGNYNNREGPLPGQYLDLFGRMGHDIVSALAREGEMRLSNGTLSLRGPDPHNLRPLDNLRSISDKEYVLHTVSGQELERKRETNAFRDAHPDAVVWCNGEYYRVSALDFASRSILCEPMRDTGLRTQGMQHIEIQFIDQPEISRLAPLNVLLQNGSVCITTSVDSYRLYRRTRVMRCRNRRCRYESPSLEIRKCPLCGSPVQVKEVERVEDTIPIKTEQPLAVELDTRATWLTLPAGLHERFDAEFWPRWETGVSANLPVIGPSFQDAVHSALHAILKAFPDIVRCDDSEIDGLCQPLLPNGEEGLLLYDNFPGGLGLVEEFFVDPELLLQGALEVVERCTCTDDEGCPLCMNRFGCSSFNQGLSKLAAQYLLRLILGQPTTTVVEELQDLVETTVKAERVVPTQEVWKMRSR